MLKKTITFKDLDGNELTEDFYFNLSQAEIAEMELSKAGGLSEYLQKIIKSEDGKEIVSVFKEILIKACGKRSDDGRRFIKSPEIIDDFVQTEAYSELFMELLSDEKFAAEFINGIIPKDLQGKTEPIIQKNAVSIVDSRLPDIDVTHMSREELIEAVRKRLAEKPSE